MNRLAVRPLRRASAALSLVGLAAALSACGGGELNEAGPDARPMAASGVEPVTPLLDDEGLPYPPVPEAVPQDPSLQRPGGLYATAAQADQLAQALGAAAIRVRVTAADQRATDEAVRSAQDRLAAQPLEADTPVLVQGDDLRRSSAVAAQLQALGFRRVFLVQP